MCSMTKNNNALKQDKLKNNKQYSREPKKKYKKNLNTTSKSNDIFNQALINY